MEVHQLRYFCAVAEHGTFTKAALAQAVSQPSLSQQIQKLEAELGARLFDRLPKSARLTAFGKAFLPKAKQILRELGEAKTEILEMAGKDRGELTVGVIPTIAPYLLPGVLTSFAQHHPSVVVKISEDITSAILDRLQDGSLDLAILALPVPGETIRVLELFREPMFAVLPSKHRYARKPAIRLEELRDEPFLLMKEGHCFRDSTIAACRKSNINPNVVFESGQFATIIAMVAAGMGVSAVPAMAVQQCAGCAYVQISTGRTHRIIGAVTMRQRFETRAQKVFMQHLKQTCASVNSGQIPGNIDKEAAQRSDELQIQPT